MHRFAIIAVILLSPLLASAHVGHSDDPIKARRAYFTLIGTNMAVLGAIAKSEESDLPTAADTYARNLGALMSYDATLHFLEGTSNEDHPGKTRALPAIWEGEGRVSDTFLKRWNVMSEAVSALKEEAGKGRAALGAALAKVGGTCKGCHDDFRAKDF